MDRNAASSLSGSAPSSPARPGSGILRDYAARNDQYSLDTPRESKESSRGLLDGHRRSASVESTVSNYDTPGLNGGTSSSSKAGLLRSINEHDEDQDGLLDQQEEDDTDEWPANGFRRRQASSSSAISEVADRAKGFVYQNRGLLMIATAQAAFATMNVLVKVMTSNAEVAVPVCELIFTRMAITWFFCYLTLRYKQIPNAMLGPPEMRGWLFIRGFVGFFGLMGSYTSLQYLSLSDATVLGFLAPSVTGLLAALFLKEPYTWKEATAGLVSLGGTVLVAQPAFLFGGMVQDEYGVTPEERLMAVGIALMGVLGASGAYVTIRQIGKRAHALHGVQYFCMACTIVSLGMPLLLHNQHFVLPAKPIFWLYLAAIGVAGFTAQYLLGKALQVERAGRAMLGNYMQLPFALLLQYIAFGETMDLLSTLGASIIMGSTIWVVTSKQAAVKETNSVVSATPRMSVDQEREAAKLEAGLMHVNAPSRIVPPIPQQHTHHRQSSSISGAVTPDVSLGRGSLEEEGARLLQPSPLR